MQIQATGTSVGTANLSDYALFTGLSGSGLVITVDQDTSNVGTHGVQIVDTTPAAPPAAVGVPEPASLTLVGTGLLGLFGYCARRRRQGEAPPCLFPGPGR